MVFFDVSGHLAHQGLFQNSIAACLFTGVVFVIMFPWRVLLIDPLRQCLALACVVRFAVSVKPVNVRRQKRDCH